MQKRRKYSEEFKREAVNLTNQPGVTQKQIADELGINANMLGRWRRDLGEFGERAFAGQGNARDADITALKRELARVKKERDILKKKRRRSSPGSPGEIPDD